MYLLNLIFIALFSLANLNEEKYGPDTPPPETGWKSALKFFSKDTNRTTASRSDNEDSDATYDQYLSLDNTLFLNSETSATTEPKGQWGLNLGYAWDRASWVSQALYLQYSDFNQASRYSLLTGFIFPGIETEFPLYLKANAGLGYFVGDFNNSTLTIDYSAAVGLRLFSTHQFLFQLEFGSQNYQRLLQKNYANSWVLSSGLAFIF
ncbi:hypothetical protein K2X05_09155 [bacterium]|nr:hypothetical protein [bacterium]